MKTVNIVLVSQLMVMILLTGCNEKMGLNIVREIPLPESYESVETITNIEESEPEVAVPIEVEFIESIDALRKKATDKGYETMDLMDFQYAFVSVEVSGFNVEAGTHFLPVMKFPSPEAAQEYGDLVNSSGHNLTIINGSYLSMVSVEEGYILYPEELEIIEYILDIKVPVIEE